MSDHDRRISARDKWTCRRFVAAFSVVMCAMSGAVGHADDPISPRVQIFTGRIRVERATPGNARVRAVILVADDGRRYILDPSEASRRPGELDGQRVEIQGELQHGYGGGPFLIVRGLKEVP